VDKKPLQSLERVTFIVLTVASIQWISDLFAIPIFW